MDESGIYDDPGTAGAQPTTEVSRPGGGGVHSGTADGANKVDPVSAGPNLGNTIAGRTTDGTLSDPDATGAGRADAGTAPRSQNAREGSTGNADQGARGVTGQTGREAGEGDEGTKSGAADQASPS